MDSHKPILNRNPFPGLRPFSTDETDLFFGREKEIMAVLKKLVKNRFVAIVGASGCGKSSIINCGILPHVAAGKYVEGNWKAIKIVPGQNPFDNLYIAINDLLPVNTYSKEDLVSLLKSDSEGLIAGLKTITDKPDEKVLLVIDQFEELFRFTSPNTGNDYLSDGFFFIETLVKTVSQVDSGVFIITIMRSDFLGECAFLSGLTKIINNSNFLIPNMTTDNYRRVIVGPLQYFGVSIENNLVDKILNDISKYKDQLPILQHTMMRVWSVWISSGESDRAISEKDYVNAGTVAQAMSIHADEAYNELNDSERDVCSKLFKAITDNGPDNRGFRRPFSIKYLKQLIDCKDEELYNVINRFRQNSRSFIVPNESKPLNEDSIIDLSHESLIRLWERLVKWIDEEASSVQTCQNLCEVAEQYYNEGRALLKQPELQIALNWRSRQKPTEAWAQLYGLQLDLALKFLAESEKKYQEEEKNKLLILKKESLRTKMLTTFLGIVALVLFVFLLFSLKKVVTAGREKEVVEQNIESLRRSEQLAYSQVDSVLAEKIITEQQLLKAEDNEKIVLKQLKQTENDIRHKEMLLDSALVISKSASEEIENANEETENMRRLRMLSIARSMSVRSVLLEGKTDLQSLLAYQAYIFNKDNGGLDNDADIYAGLYNVAKIHGHNNLKNYSGHSGSIRSIAFASNSNDFYTSGSDGKVLRWTLEGKSSSSLLVYDNDEVINVLSMSPDGKWLALGSNNSSIIVLSTSDFAIRDMLSNDKGAVKSLLFSNDNQHIYSVSVDGKVYLWDLGNKSNKELNSNGQTITSIDLSVDGKHLAGISNTGSAIVWNVNNPSDSFSPSTQGGEISVIRFKPDENIVAVGDKEGNVALWNIDSHSKISEVKSHEGTVNDIQFNVNLQQMATAGNDKSINIYNNIQDLKETPVTITDNNGPVVAIRFSDDGEFIVSGVYEDSKNLVSRPTHINSYVEDICLLLTRNMTQDEWDQYVARDIPYQETCRNPEYNIKINVIR